MSLAHRTAVRVRPNQHRSVESVGIGDPVMVATLPLRWAPMKVGFSLGTSAGGDQPAMVFVRCGDLELVVTPDHLFLTPDGHLIRASRLVAGETQLVGADGAPVDVSEVRVGAYRGGVHHISIGPTGIAPPTIDGHLVITGGVVSGDLALQVNNDDGRYEAPRGSAPTRGTKARRTR